MHFETTSDEFFVLFLRGGMMESRTERRGERRVSYWGPRNIWAEISPWHRQDERTIKAGRVTGGMQIDSNSYPPLSLYLRVPFPCSLEDSPLVPHPWNPRVRHVTSIILIYHRLRYYPQETQRDKRNYSILIMPTADWFVCFRHRYEFQFQFQSIFRVFAFF